MEHGQRKKYYRGLENLWKYYGIEKRDVEVFGEPLRMARAMKLAEKIETGWKGGPCDERNTLDIVLTVPSESRAEVNFYEIPFKVLNTGVIKKTMNCPCKDNMFTNGVSRKKIPCKHEIAGRIWLENNLEYVFRDLVERGHADAEILNVPVENLYSRSQTWWVKPKYSDTIFDTLHKLDGMNNDKFFNALMKHNIFYWKLSQEYGDRKELCSDSFIF